MRERGLAIDCWYLAGCRWPAGCGAEDKCIGHEVSTAMSVGLHCRNLSGCVSPDMCDVARTCQGQGSKALTQVR